jgi:hypothetical protein
MWKSRFGDGQGLVWSTLVFGPQDQFERYLDYTVAAFEISGSRPRDESVDDLR